MKTQGVSFRHAVELLREDSSLVANSSNAKTTTVRKLASPLSEDADKQTALQQVIAYYHDTLKQSPEALEHLKARGLDDIELIDHFKLGFANRSFGLHLPNKKRKAGVALRGLLQQVGVYRESGHEHFTGSLIVPVINNHKVYGYNVFGQRTINDQTTY